MEVCPVQRGYLCVPGRAAGADYGQTGGGTVGGIGPECVQHKVIVSSICRFFISRPELFKSLSKSAPPRPRDYYPLVGDGRRKNFQFFLLPSPGSAPLTGRCPEGVQGPPCRGSGCPRKTLFLSFCLPPTAASKKREKEVSGDTPGPGRGLAALCTPAWETSTS